MPTLAHASIDLPELKIHRFPSMDAFNAAVGNSQIGITDISFVAGDTSDVPLPTAQDVGNVLTAGASGSMYWGAGGGGGTGGDTVSGKTITLSTTGQALITVNGNDSGSVSLPSAPPSTWLGTEATEAATGDHRHGTITRNGYIRGNSSQAGGVSNDQVAIENGDRIIIADYTTRSSTNYYQPKMTSIVFDGSTTTQFLSKKGTWETPSGGGVGGATSLNELSDVNIVDTLASDQVLTFNGSSWVNQVLWLDDLRDVTISGASDGQVLTYVDGSGWINSLPSWGGSSDHDLKYEVLNPTTNSLTLTFASGTRGYKYINLSNLPSAASSVQLAIVINNNAENYIMINNQTQTPKYIDFVSITYNGVTNSNVNTTSIVPEYDTWHNVESARCKEYSINVVPIINKPIITCTNNMADLSYV